MLEEIETQMKQVVDIVIREMNQRFTRLHILDEKFGFLLDINGLLYCHVANLKEHWTTFINSYGHIVDNEGLYNDIMDCRMLLKKGKN